MTCSWQVEIDPFCRKVLAKHWPHVRRHDDVRTFPTEPIEDWNVDVVCGGFPCKQTSVAASVHGRRVGLEGADSGLWYEMLRVVRLVRPRWVVVENVAGARTWQAEIEGGLASAGYRLPRQPMCVSAEGLGAPHRRRRLFWLAHRDEPGLAVTRLPEPPEAQRQPWRAADRNPWLSALSRVVRVDDGIPGGLDRRDRINAIGNAVVPHVSEAIGRLIIWSLTREHLEPARMGSDRACAGKDGPPD